MKNAPEKAGRVLDLYARRWEGAALGDDEFVVSADEKPSIQARRRVHPSLPLLPIDPSASSMSTIAWAP